MPSARSIYCLVLAVAVASAAAIAPPGFTAGSEEGSAPSGMVLDAGAALDAGMVLDAGAATGAATRRMWIFFDRAAPGREDVESAVSPRARARTRLRGGRAAQCDPPGYPPAEMIALVIPHVERVRHRSFYFYAVSVDVKPDRVSALRALPGVARVEEVRAYRRAPIEPVPDPRDPLGFRSAHTPPQAALFGNSYGQLKMIQALELLVAGYNGSGAARGSEPVMIGVLDTGFRLDHEAFDRLDVHAEYDFINFDTVTANEPGDHPWQDRHGTLVLAVLAGFGSGDLVGPAWGARYLLAKTEIIDQEIRIEEDNWIAGLEWCDSIGADVVTSSLGYIDWYDPGMLDGNTALCTRAADIAVSRGIVVCNAAGNYGAAPMSLIAPADGHGVIAVGGVHGDGSLWHSSSRGPTADGRIKPDLVAQAVSVVSVVWGEPSGYAAYNGTSFATPLVAGLCAQLLDMHSAWSPWQLRDSLVVHASRANEPDNGYGYGIARGFDASGLAPAGSPRPLIVSRGYPNPFRTEVRFDLRADRLATISARVYDVRGAVVRRLVAEGLVILDTTIEWDGRDERGRPVASGVYWVEFRAASLRRVQKIVRVR